MTGCGFKDIQITLGLGSDILIAEC